MNNNSTELLFFFCYSKLGDKMKSYYLFKINSSYYKLTKHTPYNLYMILNGIYRSCVKDIKSAYPLYGSIITTFTKKELNTIFKSLKKDEGYQVYNRTHAYNNYFTKEASRLFVHHTYLLIKSNQEIPIFLSYINKTEHIFLCNFQNSSYFWLDEFMKNTCVKQEKKV